MKSGKWDGAKKRDFTPETGNIDTYVMGSWEPTAKDNSRPAQPILYQGAKINNDKVFSCTSY